MKPRSTLLLILLLAATTTLPACSGDAPAFFGQAEEEGPLTLYGTVDVREVALAFRLPGRLATLAVEEGDEVAPGAAIAALDDETFLEDLAVAEARVAVARAHLARLESGSRPQEIEQVRAQVTEAEARVVAARQELERKTRLLEPGASSQREVEAARERHDAAVARWGAAREALDQARAGFRTEDVAAGRAEVQLAEAELERARTALADTLLSAPAAGTVTTRVREPGSLLGAGSPVALLTLHDPLVVRAYVSEPDLGSVAPGTAVEIHTDSSSQTFTGRVGFVSPRAEFTPKSVETADLRTDLVYRVRIVVDQDSAGQHETLRQGMPVTVKVSHGAGADTRAAGD